jgi:hypothetical protein
VEIIGSIVVGEGASIVIWTELRTTSDQINFGMRRPHNKRSLGQLGIIMADDGEVIIAGKERKGSLVLSMLSTGTFRSRLPAPTSRIVEEPR